MKQLLEKMMLSLRYAKARGDARHVREIYRFHTDTNVCGGCMGIRCFGLFLEEEAVYVANEKAVFAAYGLKSATPEFAIVAQIFGLYANRLDCV